MLAAVKDTANQADPDADITFYNLRKMIDDGLLRDRLMARLSGFFGFLAVLLAVIGLYGVISYMVAQRRNEIGIRMSLGANRGSIMALVLREAALLLVILLGLLLVYSLLHLNEPDCGCFVFPRSEELALWWWPPLRNAMLLLCAARTACR